MNIIVYMLRLKKKVPVRQYPTTPRFNLRDSILAKMMDLIGV